MSRTSALEIAEGMFASYRGPASESSRIGEQALDVLLRARTVDALSSAETHCLLKAYNWAFRNEDGYAVAKRAVCVWGEEFLADLDRALHNAYYWPKGAYVARANELIREGIGPSVHWHLRKADWWVSEATGEHDSECEWFPGDEVPNQPALDEAAIELEAAIQLLPVNSPDPSWAERYAPLLEQPRFSRFRAVARDA